MVPHFRTEGEGSIIVRERTTANNFPRVNFLRRTLQILTDEEKRLLRIELRSPAHTRDRPSPARLAQLWWLMGERLADPANLEQLGPENILPAQHSALNTPNKNLVDLVVDTLDLGAWPYLFEAIQQNPRYAFEIIQVARASQTSLASASTPSLPATVNPFSSGSERSELVATRTTVLNGHSTSQTNADLKED